MREAMSWVECFGWTGSMSLSCSSSESVVGSGGGDGDGEGLDIPCHSLVYLETARGTKAKGVVIGWVHESVANASFLYNMRH